MRVVAFGTYDKHTHPRVAVLLDGLGEHHVDVEECNAPLGLDTASRVRMLHRPWLMPALLLRVLSRWVWLARNLSRHLPADAVLVGYLGHFDVLLARALCRRRYTVVLDHLVSAHDTAVDRGATNRAVLWALRMLDRVAVASADLVLVDTEESGRLVPARHRDRLLVVPVGATEDWQQAERRDSNDSDPMRVVFFGTFTPLQGAVVVAEATRLLDSHDIAVTLIGGGQQETEVRRRVAPHVRWRPWMDPDALAGEVAAHDVCLGIFGTSDKAMRVVPNKVFQGAAAGCAIVTSDTAPQRRAFEGAGVFVPAGDPGALARALTELARDRARVAALRTGAARIAAGFTPRNVVTPLVEALQHAVAPVTGSSDERSPCSLP